MKYLLGNNDIYDIPFSLNYIIFPVIVGSVVIIILSFLINKFLLKRDYPKRWF